MSQEDVAEDSEGDSEERESRRGRSITRRKSSKRMSVISQVDPAAARQRSLVVPTSAEGVGPGWLECANLGLFSLGGCACHSRGGGGADSGPTWAERAGAWWLAWL